MNKKYIIVSIVSLIATVFLLSSASQAQAAPDLIITDIKPQGTTINYTVKNQGSSESGVSEICPDGKFYQRLWVDGLLIKSFGSGSCLGAVRSPVDSLSAGASKTGSFDYKWTCSGETDQIKVCADDTAPGGITESNEENNCLIRAFRCSDGAPIATVGTTLCYLAASHGAILHIGLSQTFSVYALGSDTKFCPTTSAFNRVIPGATVTITNPNSGYTKSGVTNQSGKITLSVENKITRNECYDVYDKVCRGEFYNFKVEKEGYISATGRFFVKPPDTTVPGSSCQCASWQNQGCGAGTCGSTKMYQTRSCSPAKCDTEKRCTSDSDCEVEVCAQMMTSCINPETNKCADYPDSCSAPDVCIPCDTLNYSAITLKLLKGWNIISSPSETPLTLSKIEEFCSLGLYKNQKMWSYDAGSKQWTNPSEVKKGGGAYIWAKEDCIINIDGISAVVPVKSLKKGWNLISSNKPLNEILGNCEINSSPSIWAWDTQLKKWVHLSTSENLSTTKGYWISVKNDCQLARSGDAGVSSPGETQKNTGIFGGIATWLQERSIIKKIGVTPLKPTIGYDSWWVDQRKMELQKLGKSAQEAQRLALEEYAIAKAAVAQGVPLNTQQSIMNVALKDWIWMKQAEAETELGRKLTQAEMYELQWKLAEKLGLYALSNQLKNVWEAVNGAGGPTPAEELEVVYQNGCWVAKQKNMRAYPD